MRREWTEIPPTSLLGWLLRLPLRLIPKKAVLNIRSGVNRGMRWVIGSGIYSYWLGTYELEKQTVMQRFVKPGMTVFDIGANAGFYTLFFSRLAGDEGRVWAFEPLPENANNILRHIKLNGLCNATLLQAAVSNRVGAIGFRVAENNSSGAIGNGGEFLVSAFSLDYLVDKVTPIPELIKIDVEGAESSVLEGAKSLLSREKPVVFIALHGEEQRIRCHGILEDLGYQSFVLGESQDEIYALPKQGVA